MAKKVLRTQDKLKVVIDLNTDTKLYEAPINPPNTGSKYTDGTDLMAHKARSGNVYFYTYYWSMWQGVEEEFELVTENQAEEFLLDKMALPYPAELTGSEIKTAKEYGFELLEENA